MQYRKNLEVVVLSGKGGTGKTSLCASFAVLAKDDAVVADCDVEAANMHLLLKPDFAEAHDFYSGTYAVVDRKTCNLCGLCRRTCRFGAISISQERCTISAMECEGCGYCARICPASAIRMQPAHSGRLFVSQNRLHAPMVHARLSIGAGNSGKLVARVKKEANAIAKKQNKPFIIVDGPPGIGCPVISSLADTDLVVLVAEPAASGIHDLMRLAEVVRTFQIPMACVVNKYDINQEKTAELKRFLVRQDIPHLIDIPFDDSFARAMVEEKTMVEMPSPAEEAIKEAWIAIQEYCLARS